MPTPRTGEHLKTLDLPISVKATGRTLEGHGSIFNNVDLGGDIVLPGAFKRTIAEHKAAGTMPAMLWQHDSRSPIGVWNEMAEDGDGLAMKGELADTVQGRDARILTGMKAIAGLSIGFEIAKDGFDFDNDGNRLLTELKLWEVSLVTFPMNPEAQVESIKSRYTARTLERHLREVGCSHNEAKELVHDTYQREVDDEADWLREVVEPVTGTDEAIAKMIRETNDELVADQMRKLHRS